MEISELAHILTNCLDYFFRSLLCSDVKPMCRFVKLLIIFKIVSKHPPILPRLFLYHSGNVLIANCK